MGRVLDAVREMRSELRGPDGKMYYGWWNVLAVYPIVMFIFSTPMLMLHYIYPSVEGALGMTRAEVVAISSVNSE